LHPLSDSEPAQAEKVLPCLVSFQHPPLSTAHRPGPTALHSLYPSPSYCTPSTTGHSQVRPRYVSLQAVTLVLSSRQQPPLLFRHSSVSMSVM
jgi:hypothetical protein